jgi:DNA mismatch repair ATPase MutS
MVRIPVEALTLRTAAILRYATKRSLVIMDE